MGLADESHVIGTTNQLKAEYGALRPPTGILFALLSWPQSHRPVLPWLHDRERSKCSSSLPKDRLVARNIDKLKFDCRYGNLRSAPRTAWDHPGLPPLPHDRHHGQRRDATQRRCARFWAPRDGFLRAVLACLADPPVLILSDGLPVAWSQ